jgi:hypothetical protein
MVAANFLWNPGSSNNGLTATAFTLMNTELNGVTTGTTVYGSSVFDNTSPAQAIWARLFLTLGSIGTAMAAGANVCGWFLPSYDGGTTYEQGTYSPVRAPDFLFPLPATSFTGPLVWASAGLILLPSLKFKMAAQNNTNQTLAGSAANFIRAAPVNMQSL